MENLSEQFRTKVRILESDINNLLNKFNEENGDCKYQINCNREHYETDKKNNIWKQFNHTRIEITLP